MANENRHLKDFESFMEIRLKASTDFVEEKLESLEKISAKRPPATISPPPGICVQGVTEMNAFNEKGAENFLPGAKNEFEVMHQDADEYLAYWTGTQRSVVKIKGQYNYVVFNLCASKKISHNKNFPCSRCANKESAVERNLSSTYGMAVLGC